MNLRHLLAWHRLSQSSSVDFAFCICFLQIAAEYSECPSGKKGGDLGWFPRGKMAGPFQEVAFNTPVGVTSAPFKSTWVSLVSLISFSP